MDVKIKEAEFKLCMYLIKHNQPFLSMEHLPKLLKSMDPTSKIFEKVQCYRTKATQIVKFFGNEAQESLAKILNETKFSLIIDEATDITMKKCLAYLTRYVDRNKRKVRDQLLTFVKVEETTAEGLVNAIFTTLHHNIIGFGADNASVMMGDQVGVKAKLQQRVPDIFVLGCVCHSMALCASKSAETLPDWVEEFACDVYNYISNSSHRLAHLQEIQELLELKPHKILKLSQTRWLFLEVFYKHT